ncbi:MAG: LysR family transcriptional regulator [Rhodobacter sp.]|nr:LysR family transcriptional regulator [Rhodobacter sp.]
MHKDNWDDLRFVLAVAQNGSVSAAARVLGVNHATVLRRIAAFESRYEHPIFEKTPRGYSVAHDQGRIIEAAREVEAAILTVDRIIEGAQAPLSGVVRVTSTDTFCHNLLPAMIAGLRRTASDLRVDLICSNAHVDLARLHAEVTVRPAVALPDDLQGEVAARLGFAVYCAPDAPRLWLGPTGALARSRPALWLQDHVAPDSLVGAADSFVTLREMAAAGLGRAILPCILGDGDPRLIRDQVDMPDLSVDIWVASHADLADVPRIRAVCTYLVAAMAQKHAALAGAA